MNTSLVSPGRSRDPAKNQDDGWKNRTGRAGAERIRKTITDSPVNTPQGTITIGVSIGIASNNDKISSVEEMINQADIALLKAKKAGKNQVAAAE